LDYPGDHVVTAIPARAGDDIAARQDSESRQGIEIKLDRRKFLRFSAGAKILPARSLRTQAKPAAAT